MVIDEATNGLPAIDDAVRSSDDNDDVVFAVSQDDPAADEPTEKKGE
jgi:hypothetical protein